MQKMSIAARDVEVPYCGYSYSEEQHEAEQKRPKRSISSQQQICDHGRVMSTFFVAYILVWASYWVLSHEVFSAALCKSGIMSIKQQVTAELSLWLDNDFEICFQRYILYNLCKNISPIFRGKRPSTSKDSRYIYISFIYPRVTISLVCHIITNVHTKYFSIFAPKYFENNFSSMHFLNMPFSKWWIVF